ncbi:hypothetical protein BDC45DRAFT_64473 [Circinella umbellata]|nr:hypothetical protein BDC45DRAFT_64473 [Circinella umbellata]
MRPTALLPTRSLICSNLQMNDSNKRRNRWIELEEITAVSLCVCVYMLHPFHILFLNLLSC